MLVHAVTVTTPLKQPCPDIRSEIDVLKDGKLVRGLWVRDEGVYPAQRSSGKRPIVLW